MKIFLALVVAAVIAFFLLRSPAPIEHAEEPPTPAPVVVKRTFYKTLLTPAYQTLIEGSTNLQEMGAEVTSLQARFANIPPTADRDTAIRICATIGRAAVLTHTMVERAHQPSPRSKAPPGAGRETIERAEREAQATDAFFKKGVELEWKAQLVPLQTEARAEWARLADTASF